MNFRMSQFILNNLEMLMTENLTKATGRSM